MAFAGFLSQWAVPRLTFCCCVLQTVPKCPALYRNTFTYHTVEDAPPEFEECFTFLGKVIMQQVCVPGLRPGSPCNGS
jgi:hypothetical protein